MEDVKPVKESKDNVDTISSDDDDGIPTVRVGNEEIAITDVNEGIISKMNESEKEKYLSVFQDFYSHMYD